MEEIERLIRADAAAVEEIDALLQQLNPETGRATMTRLQEVIDSPSTELWVVKKDNRIIGMATVNFMQRAMGVAGYIDDVVIDENHRGEGLGQKLMERVIESARARGAHRVSLTSRSDRTVAHALYQKLGFTKKPTNAFRLDLK